MSFRDSFRRAFFVQKSKMDNKSLSHLSKICELVRRGDEFRFAFVKKDGSIVRGERCVCVSFHSSGATMNVKWTDSGEIRKVRRRSIIEFNGAEVVL